MIGFDVPCSVVRGAMEHFRERMHVGDYLIQKVQVEMIRFAAEEKRLGLTGVWQLNNYENLCRGEYPISGRQPMVGNKAGHQRECSNSQFTPSIDVSIRHSRVIYSEVHLRGRRETVIFGVMEESPVIRKVRRPCKTA